MTQKKRVKKVAAPKDDRMVVNLAMPQPMYNVLHRAAQITEQEVAVITLSVVGLFLAQGERRQVGGQQP